MRENCRTKKILNIVSKNGLEYKLFQKKVGKMKEAEEKMLLHGEGL